jgi:hypothetical protein
VDELHDWAKQRPGLFVSMDQAIVTRAASIVNQFPALVDPAKTRGTADPFVIALAVERQLIVVTAEHSKPTRPRIPDVCQQLSVPWISLLELFRREKWVV